MWNDAITRVNYDDTDSMQGPMITKRRDMPFSRYPKASDVIHYVRHGYSKPTVGWAWPGEKCFSMLTFEFAIC